MYSKNSFFIIARSYKQKKVQWCGLSRFARTLTGLFIAFGKRFWQLKIHNSALVNGGL